MPLLTLAPSKAFVWIGTPEEANAAKDLLRGWHRTTVAPPGEVRCYTGDLAGKPMFNPWAALYFIDSADAETRQVLEPLWREYQASFALDGPDLAPMPEGEALLPFQKAGVAYALRREHVLIGDPMGLGKTIQAIAILNARKAQRVLVLCPAAVVPQWEHYLRRWLLPLRPGYPDVFIRMTRDTVTIHPKARVVLCSYDRAKQKSVTPLLLKEQWDHLILDEAHYLRHHTALRTKAILGAYKKGAEPGLVAKADHIIALSGTPLPNRPREAYTLARALDWESISLMSEQTFQDRFNPSRTFWVTDKSGLQRPVLREATGRLPELQARLRCGFMVRREKEAAAPQLPAKIYDIVLMSNDAVRSVVRAESALQLDVDHLETIPIQLQGPIAKLRREMAFAMLPLIQDHLASMLAEDDKKIVVFAHHLELIKLLREHFRTVRPAVITGALSGTQRAEQVKRFISDPVCRLFIGQIQAAGTGIDGLHTVSTTAVFAEPSWVPAENEQAIDRLHRVGQTLPVLAQFLVGEGSLNARIVSRYVEKSRVQHVALDARVA